MCIILGRIKWSRCLMYNMTETVESVCAHPVLNGLPAAADMMRKYTYTRTLIMNYEETMTAVWMNQNVCIEILCCDNSFSIQVVYLFTVIAYIVLLTIK